MVSCSGNSSLSHPATCAGDHSNANLLATSCWSRGMCEATGLGASCARPGLRVGLSGAIRVGSPMAVDFPAHGRGRSTKGGRDLADRMSHRHPTRNLFSLRQCQSPARSPANGRKKSSVRGHHPMNRSRVLAERSPDLAQRLPLFPSLPEVRFLGRRQARTSHRCHGDHPPPPLYPRGCCIDHLNLPSATARCASTEATRLPRCSFSETALRNVRKKAIGSSFLESASFIVRHACTKAKIGDARNSGTMIYPRLL